MSRRWRCLISAAFLAAVTARCSEDGAPKRSSLGLSHAVTSMAASWGLGSSCRIAQVVGPNITYRHVLDQPPDGARLVVLLGEALPRRRNAAQQEPFLTLQKDRHLPYVPVDAINAGAISLEKVLSRPLYAFRIAGTLPGNINRTSGPHSCSCLCVYDVSSGNIYLHERLEEGLRNGYAIAGDAIRTFVDRLVEAAKDSITASTAQEPKDLGSGRAVVVMSRAAAAAAALAFAATVPTWFCIACPIVLGMLAPFLLNFGFGAVAELTCEHYRLPQDECNELWYGAFALALVLSLTSAIPIVFLCRLPECARPHGAVVAGL